MSRDRRRASLRSRRWEGGVPESHTPKDAGPAYSSLSGARRGLQRAGLFLALMVVPVFLGLLLGAGSQQDRGGVLFRVFEKWGVLAPAILGLPALVLLLAACAVRLLPGGREAAAAAPMLRRERSGGPRRVSVGAVAGIVTLLLFGAVTADQAYEGVRALSGSGLVLTVGEDTHVVRSEESAGRGNNTNYFLSTPYGEAIAEGDPSDGDRYGVYPVDATRAWRIGAYGWLMSLFVTALAAGMLGGAAVWARLQWRRFRARRTWRARQPRNGRALAVTYSTVAGLAACAAGGWVVAEEAAAGGTYATLVIPGAAEHELSEFWVRDSEAYPPYYLQDDPVPAPLRSRSVVENRDDDFGDLDVSARLYTYPSAADAEAALGLWAEEQEGRRMELADGSEGIWHEQFTEVATATTRGEVLVVVEVDEWFWDLEPDEVEAFLQQETPEIRDLVADHHRQLLDAEIPWWG
ncbi:hypothetical protein [Blastococcus sp. TF02A-35]|uniref:hypothetical protein n=1 Tax=Blastococcus sp. TF02A-35 TaxID=2559612 RepID=UPI0010747F23|nr:hypothetical protein [Blastococcus sp. TF02A_35]TFV52881.1 hypothetical protein E4P43_04590 [Blastococcus sp. TF02A_35]